MRTILITLFATCAIAGAALPPLPKPATSFGAAMTDGWLYVYGGNTGRAHEFHTDCVSGSFARLKVGQSESWEILPGGTALLSPSLVAHDGKIIRVGGLNPANAKGEKVNLSSVSEVIRYDPSTQKWEALPSLPEARSSHDSVVIGDQLYVGGGWKLSQDDGEGTGAKWHDTALSLDLKNPAPGWRIHPQPFQRRALAAAVSDGRIWFIGGMGDDDKPSRAVDWWEPASGKWGSGPALPDGAMAGFGVAACVVEGRIVASPLSGKLSRLSGDFSAWEPAGSLSKPRFFHRLIPIADGRVLTVGGSSRKEQIPALEYVKIGEEAATSPEPAKAGEAPSSSAVPQLPSEPGRESWPQWRGPNRDGIAVGLTKWRKDWPTAGLPVLWRAKVGAGMSSPVVAEGRVILHGNDGAGMDNVVALDAASGRELWRFSVACVSESHEMPIVPKGPGATPTIAGGFVYVLTREGVIACLDIATGKPAWQRSLIGDLGGKRPVYGYTQSPLVADGRVILDVGCVAGGNSSTAALDATTGDLKWASGTGEAGYSSARMFAQDGSKWIAMLKGEAFHLYDFSDGRVLAEHRMTARDFSNAVTPTFVGGRILVSNTGTEPAVLLAIGGGHELSPAWTHKQFALLFNSPIVHGSSVFAFNEKRRGHHEFTCIDSANGETRWVSDAVATSTFIATDSHWIFLTRDGELALAPASEEGLRVIAKFSALPGKTYATPALVDGRIFVRNNEGEVAAFDAR
jgi:outer membrane protein assembly factor BamB